MSNKVVYNACYGGFGLSEKAISLGRKISGDPHWPECEDSLPRHDGVLVAVVEQLGDKASGRYAKLRIGIVGNMYRIDEYDGYESVQEPNDIEWVVIK